MIHLFCVSYSNGQAQVWCPARIICYADYRFAVVTCQWLMMELSNGMIQRSYKILSTNKNRALFTWTTSVSHAFVVCIVNEFHLLSVAE